MAYPHTLSHAYNACVTADRNSDRNDKFEWFDFVRAALIRPKWHGPCTLPAQVFSFSIDEIEPTRKSGH